MNHINAAGELSKVRLDKWLWCARFLKTRTAATTFCVENRIRINGHVVQKAGIFIQVGDILTFAWQDSVLVLKVLALAERRGAAIEARKLYEKIGLSQAAQNSLILM